VKDRRKFIRFPVRLSARYSEENKEDWKQQCSIVNISREGMGVTVYLKTKLSLGCMLKFMVDIPEREKSVSFNPEDKWALLDYAYEAWKEKLEADGIKEAPSK